MKPRLNIQRLHELLGIVLNGLDGQPFSWGNGQRRAWVPILKAAGITLITKTQIEKHGYKLKRGAKPVGSAYFGAPIKRYADLWVLEVQCTKSKPRDTDCWLFLDCEQMTGKPPEKCPNRKACKQNARNSSNLRCQLPYEIQEWHPLYSSILPSLKSWLIVKRDMPEEAKRVGWEPAERLEWYWYCHKDNILWVGREGWGGAYHPKLPEALVELGWSTSVSLPYWLANGYWEVIAPIDGCNSEAGKRQLELGWHRASALPYYQLLRGVPSHELHVSFYKNHPDYEALLAAGWYPASELPIHPV